MSDLAQSPAVRRLVPAGERVVLAMRPSIFFVPLAPLGSIVIVVLGAWLAVWALDRLAIAAAGDRELARRLRDTGALVVGAATAAVVVRILWQTLEWWCRLYVLTERRLLRVSGVLRRSVVDIPVANVQHTSIYRSLRERLTGLGTIGINTSGTAFTEMFWNMVARPGEVHATIRASIAARGGVSSPGEAGRPLIVGLAGGIASGKSAVAREMQRRGALLIDSDREAKEALDRPEVRDELVRWWGASVLNAEGRVDRSKVASIIFADAEERRRLEALVHPIVRHTRARLVEQAAGRGVRLVVVDAPLLFEAGVDKECDKVVFVEAPRDVRLERARQTRGWDEAEFDRREKAQLPLEEKRLRADAIVSNDATEADLAQRVGQLLSSYGL